MENYDYVDEQGVRHIRLSTGGKWTLASPPVLWYALVRDIEAVTIATGWGLAPIWGAIHSGDYERASKGLAELLAGADEETNTKCQKALASARTISI
jgi:hypothetical protein